MMRTSESGPSVYPQSGRLDEADVRYVREAGGKAAREEDDLFNDSKATGFLRSQFRHMKVEQGYDRSRTAPAMQFLFSDNEDWMPQDVPNG